MKLCKAAIVTSTLSFVCISAFAGQYVTTGGNVAERLGSKTFDTATVQSKQEAYQLGLEQLHQLDTSSPEELSKELSLIAGNTVPNQVHLNKDGYVTVEEFMNSNGDIAYKGHVAVTYHFAQRESSNN